MKVKIVLFLVFTASLSLILSSYRNGAAAHIGWDGTGAAGTTTGCTNGGGCHNSTTSINTTVELDSAGAPVTSYYPDGVYTVKISATNNTGGTFGSFGFQLVTVFDSASGTLSATQAGTWGSLPANVQSTPGSGRRTFPVIEHNTAIPATSGSGGNGTVYSESIPWTAPAAGAGAIKIYGVLNAVTGLDIAFLTAYQVATPVVIPVANGATGITPVYGWGNAGVYPTLVNADVNVALNLKQTVLVNAALVSINGEVVKWLFNDEVVEAGPYRHNFNLGDIKTGIYFLRLNIGNETLVTKLVKE